MKDILLETGQPTNEMTSIIEVSGTETALVELLWWNATLRDSSGPFSKLSVPSSLLTF